MPTFSSHYFEELKNCVLTAAGIDSLIPADCKLISASINAKTRQNISETTVKRIYGFAYTKFRPSLFTMDVLAKYCDFNGWEDFCEKQYSLSQKSSTADLSWQMLQQNARKITGFTLQALKNKSGVPYGQTIKREFIDHHFEEFLASGCIGTVLSAPAGYGKTIALCHWIDEKIEADATTGNNDIILLFSSNALMSVLLSGRDINDWMLALLGYSADNDINILMDVKQRKNSKFYLVIDGLDEFMFKQDQFRIILNQLIDIFSFYQSHDWFKLILTTRSATWVNNSHEIEAGYQQWFTNFKNDDGYSNVPLFSETEIRDLCRKINPATPDTIHPEATENFNNPLYFQFYYKLHKDKFSLNDADRLSIYELISTFILNKVYLGHHSADKILLIKKLVEELDIVNNVYKINKLKINTLVKQYGHAYQELLSIGFIRELNESSNYQYNTNIVFGNNNFLEHSIAKTILYKSGNLFDADLIKAINTQLVNSPGKVKVLKWCIMHAVKTGQLAGLAHITDTQLDPNQKLDLLTFLGEVLESEYSSQKKKDALLDYLKNAFSTKLFDYFFGLELIDPEYKRTLNVLLHFELSNKKRVMIYTALGVIAVMQLDLNELEACLAKLKSIPKADYVSFIIDPLDCLDAVYYQLKYGIIKKEVLVELTKLSFEKLDAPAVLKKSAANDLLCLLGAYTLMLGNDPSRIIRFAEVLNSGYRADQLESATLQYGFFIRKLMADAYFELGDTAKMSEIFYSIDTFIKKDLEILTPHMKVLYHSLKIKTLLNTPKESLAVNEMKIINAIADEHGYRFSKAYTSAMLLKYSTLHSSAPAFHRQLEQEFRTMTSQAGIDINAFLVNQ